MTNPTITPARAALNKLQRTEMDMAFHFVATGELDEAARWQLVQRISQLRMAVRESERQEKRNE